MWDWSKLTCAKRMEFSGMIHWLTINNHPSNPPATPSNPSIPYKKMWNPRMKMTQRTRKTIDDVHIEPPTAANLSTFATLIIPIYAHPLQEVGTHLKTVPHILTRRRLITPTPTTTTTTTTRRRTRDIMLSIHSGIWRYELVASDHLPPWLARPGFATDAEELLCSQIQILFL